MPRGHFLFAATTLAFVLVNAPLVLAADQATDPAADTEEQVDDGLKKFGYLTGLASGCVKPEQKADLEREALDLSNGIGRLLRTDRSFSMPRPSAMAPRSSWRHRIASPCSSAMKNGSRNSAPAREA